MSDDTETDTPAPAAKPAKPAEVAKIRALDALRAKGFTFAKGKIIPAVPLAHAEFLVKDGKAEILEVS